MEPLVFLEDILVLVKPPDIGISALLDTDRVMASAGLNVQTEDPLGLLQGPIQFDLYGQFHGYMPRVLPHESEEPKAGFPTVGNNLPVGGTGWDIGGQWQFEY